MRHAFCKVASSVLNALSLALIIIGTSGLVSAEPLDPPPPPPPLVQPCGYLVPILFPGSGGFPISTGFVACIGVNPCFFGQTCQPATVGWPFNIHTECRCRW